MRKTIKLIFHNIRKSKAICIVTIIQATLGITLLALAINYYAQTFNTMIAFDKSGLTNCYQTNFGGKYYELNDKLYNELGKVSDYDNWMISMYSYGNFEGKKSIAFSAFNKNLADKAYIPIVDGNWFDTSSDEVQIIIPNEFIADKSLKLGETGTFVINDYYNKTTKKVNAKVVGVYDYLLSTSYNGGDITNMYNDYRSSNGTNERPIILYINDFKKLGVSGNLNSAFVDKDKVKSGVDLSSYDTGYETIFHDTSEYHDDVINSNLMMYIIIFGFIIILMGYSFFGLCGLSIMRSIKTKHSYTVYNLSGCSVKKCIGIEFLTEFIPYILGVALSVVAIILLKKYKLAFYVDSSLYIAIGINALLMAIIFLQSIFSLSRNKIIKSIRMGSNERYY